MEDILKNLALISLNNFCLAHDIRIREGTHCVKRGRGFQYDLVRDSDEKLIVSVVFHKTQMPTYSVNENYFREEK